MSTRSLIRRGLALLAMAVALAGTALAAITIWQGKSDGRSAEAQFSDSIGGGRINVFQSGNSAFMFYEVWGSDPLSESCTSYTDVFGNLITTCSFARTNYDYGWGEIPSTDILFTATGATLRTTTGASFATTRCTTDTSGPTPITSCVPAGSVTLDLDWTSNFAGTVCTFTSTTRFCEPPVPAVPSPVLTSRSTSGLSRYSLGTFRFENLTSIKERTAFVDGTALGRELSFAPGRLGQTAGREIATN